MLTFEEVWKASTAKLELKHWIKRRLKAGQGSIRT